MEESTPEKTSGYGKRPLWQWILIYIVIGGILYFLIYKFVITKNGGGYSSGGSYSAPQTQGTSGY